ncbi:MAG: lysophospholipid acyltransferase family protein [Acidobacteriota bacterium]
MSNEPVSVRTSGSERSERPDRSDRRVGPISWLAAMFIRALRATCRLDYRNDGEIRRREQAGERFLLGFWHRHLLLMPYGYRGQKISVLISSSRDGELIARTVSRLGIDASRGSTTRGGAAGLRELLRKAKAGFDIAFTPDGPKGPRGKVQAGTLLAAAATGFPIVPVGLAASRAKLLRSWDRFVVPWPFSRVVFVYGEPLEVERGAPLELYGEELERRLDACEAEAERIVNRR